VKKRIFIKPSLLITCIFLIGCASHHSSKTSSLNDPSNTSLVEAATSVSHSLEHLAATEQAAFHPIADQSMPDPSTYGMGARASIDWSGPIEPLIQEIAQTAYYRTKIVGHEPAVPILVTINAKNEMLGDILSNVSFQCGKRADVILYPDTQTIELRYAEN
jgi:defect-in-organelle-trafficking protein DotD